MFMKTRQVGRGVKSWLGFTRRSNVWCYGPEHRSLLAALQAKVAELMKSDDPIASSIRWLYEAYYKKNSNEMIKRGLDAQIQNLVRQIRNSRDFRGSFGRCTGRKVRAPDDETVNVDNQIRNLIVTHLPLYKDTGRQMRATDDQTVDTHQLPLDIFQPFRPLMLPLSGVTKMCLLTRGAQKIFLIGELHGYEFCRKKGYTPIAELFEEYLATRSPFEPVDFMIEMSNKNSVGNLEETRRIVKEQHNRPLQGTEEPMNILQLTRTLAMHFLPPNTGNPNSRVHWLDPDLPPDLTTNANKLLTLFDQFNWARSSTNMLFIWRNRIDQLLKHAFAFTPQWSAKNEGYKEANSFVYEEVSAFNASIGTKHPEIYRLNYDEGQNFRSATEADKIIFFKACYIALKGSNFFKKCYGHASRQAPPSWEIYRDSFIEALRNEPQDINSFYFYVQRFFMDMYACCRIMKQDAGWYKNIVIYAGEWHVENYINILQKCGYERHELPERIQFNPECKD